MAKKVKNKEEMEIDPLEAIKRLLILLLIRDGATGEDIATALKVNKSTVTRMFPIRKVKKSK